MSITFSNVNFKWENIRRNKEDWVKIIVAGTITSVLYNIWLYAPQLQGETIGYKIAIGIVALSSTPTWGLAFSFAAGAVAKQADFVEQIVMMFIAAFGLALISSIFPIFFGIGSIGLIFFSFAFVFSLVIGFVPGFGFSLLLEKYVYKTSVKEIKEKNYVSYTDLDDGTKM